MGLSGLLLVLAAAAPAGAPIAEVWPYQARRLLAGELEYSYDLTGVKKHGSTPDAVAAHGEQKVREFLAGLPDETKVKIKPGTPLSLGAGRGAEPGPLVTSLSAISAAKVVSNDPLARAPGALMRPALHPEEPKLLLSAEAVLWRARRLVEGAQAAVTLDSERLHAALWGKLAERTLARLKTANGDAKEGAVALAGRLFAAGACLDSGKVPAAAKAHPEVAAATEAELVAARADPDTVVAPGMHGWSRELACARVRLRLLARPFPQSRAGASAALTLLGLLAADPKLEAGWNALRARRDTLGQGPAKDALLDYRERTAGKVEDALENLAAFIDALGERLPPVPAPLEQGMTPFGLFYAELEPAGRASAVDELLAAAQDGRLALPPGEKGPPFPLFEGALAGLVVDESKRVVLDAAWRARRSTGFAALVGGHRDTPDEGRDLTESQDERSKLVLRLLVPPTLEVEPAPQAYRLAARALEQLVAVAGKLGVGGLQLQQPEGGRGAETIAGEAQRMASVLRGLAGLATDGVPAEGDPDLVAARRFLAAWRADPAFGRDVREARALELTQGSQRLHAAIVGVARRELLVGFQAAISSTVGAPGPFEVAPAEQRYLVPVLITRGALAAATAPALDRAALKALCEGAKRQPNEIEAALVERMTAR